jgi:hypothetical protein
LVLYRGAIDHILYQAFTETVDAYADQCQAEFTTVQYSWPGETKRRDGSIAGTNRDISDTGELAESQQPPEYLTPLMAEIAWTANHALITHEGDGDGRPARPWTQTALQNLDIIDTFAHEARKLL